MSIPEVPYPMNQQADPLRKLKEQLIEAERATGTTVTMEQLDGLTEEELKQRIKVAVMAGPMFVSQPPRDDGTGFTRPMMMVYAGPQQMQKMAEGGGGFTGFQLPAESEKPAGYCSECGVPLKRRSRFCPECGARLNWE